MRYSEIVMVHLPYDVKMNQPYLKYFDGGKYKIVEVKSYGGEQAVRLDGAESRYGIPYWFLRGWLMPVMVFYD